MSTENGLLYPCHVDTVLHGQGGKGNQLRDTGPNRPGSVTLDLDAGSTMMNKLELLNRALNVALGPCLILEVAHAMEGWTKK